ncbi:MAG: zinc-dependent metalloprotease [Bacteroidota bacterium]
MNKFYSTFWTILLYSSSLLAQPTQHAPCGTPAAPESVRQFIQSLDYSVLPEDPTRINIPVTIHIVKATNGSGGFLENNAFLTICDLNQRMASAGLFFYVPGAVRFILSDALYNPVDYGPLNTMISQNNVARTMNIYYTNLGAMSLCGFAFYPNSGPGGAQNNGAVVMSFACSQPNGTTLTHEVGHFFNLPHTFDQTSNDPTASSAERVTRNFNEPSPRLSANCNTEGDNFCDTPADFIDNRWNCPTGIIQLDINGDRFRPDSSYYMSYSSDQCMSRFSDQQITAMRATLTTTNSPRGYLTINPMPAYPDITTGAALISPATADTFPGNYVVFRWNRTPGATAYQIKILLFNFSVLDTITTDTFYISQARLIRANREHSWQVRALNGANLCTPYSDRIFFYAGAYITNVGIRSESQSNAWMVYPTLFEAGVSHPLNIVGLTENAQAKAVISDASGRTIQEWTIEQNLDQLKISLPPLASGLYYIHIQQNQQRKAFKFVIQ